MNLLSHKNFLKKINWTISGGQSDVLYCNKSLNRFLTNSPQYKNANIATLILVASLEIKKKTNGICDLEMQDI